MLRKQLLSNTPTSSVGISKYLGCKYWKEKSKSFNDFDGMGFRTTYISQTVTKWKIA